MGCFGGKLDPEQWSPLTLPRYIITEAGVPASSVSLHYRARITQRTGEVWTDVGLTLSTDDIHLSNQAIPVLNPTKI